MLCYFRKDSFITHRAFCDALAEENYRANHGLAAMVGTLQSQNQEMFSNSMPSLNSSNIDTVMNSSTSEPQPNNPLKSLSLNPFIPNTSDIMFNPSSSSLQLPMNNSSYMSATALLQKAAEMGAKISDDSISPILLRGFTGYSSTPRPSEVSESRQSTFAPIAQRSGGSQGGSMVVNNCEEIVEGRDVRMTQDFLGLGESSYGANGVGLSYGDGQQESQQVMYSYQHMPHGPNAMEKQVWDF